MNYGQNGQEELKESDATSQMLKALPCSLWHALDPLEAQPPSTTLVHGLSPWALLGLKRLSGRSPPPTILQPVVLFRHFGSSQVDPAKENVSSAKEMINDEWLDEKNIWG